MVIKPVKNRIQFLLNAGAGLFLLMCAESMAVETNLGSSGPLLAKVLENLSRTTVEVCDRHDSEIQKELAQALDVRKAELDTYVRAHPVTSDSKKVRLGPILAEVRRKKERPSKGWEVREDSWKEAYEDYLEIKNEPVNFAWVVLNVDVQSLIGDDRDRLSGDNVYLDKDSEKILKQAVSAIDRCIEVGIETGIESDACSSNSSLGAEADRFFDNPHYLAYLKANEEKIQNSDRVEALKIRKNYFIKALRKYEFRPNPAVFSKSGNEIILPLHSGAFAGYEKDLEKVIESVWKNSSLKLKIQWVASHELPGVFTFRIGTSLEQRPFTQLNQKFIQLFPFVRLKAVAHEIGHVLGFRDHYHTVWKPKECRYQSQHNQNDLMSDSWNGHVTSEEWSTLKQAYLK